MFKIVSSEDKPKRLQGKINKAIWEGIKSGARYTTTEWAKHLGIKKTAVERTIAQLRNRGFFVYPVGGYINPYEREFKEGVLVDIMERKSWFNEVMLRNKSQRLMPALRRFTEHMETAALALPEILKELETEAVEVFGVFDQVQKYTQKQLTERTHKK